MNGKPTHGMTGTPEYRSWQQAKSRCFNPKNPRWDRYGGRGITMCERWRNSFPSFYKDMGIRRAGTSLERMDNNGHYEPGNCVWATYKQQSNNMHVNVFIEHRGQRLTIAQWEGRTGIDRGTIRARKRRGWTTDEIFNSDVTKTRKRVLPKPSRPSCLVNNCGREAAGLGALCLRHAQATRRGMQFRNLRTDHLPSRAKLTPANVISLRLALRAGRPTLEIARQFGVSKATVRDIARGKTWMGVEL
jgi:hypothetical protein